MNNINKELEELIKKNNLIIKNKYKNILDLINEIKKISE